MMVKPAVCMRSRPVTEIRLPVDLKKESGRDGDGDGDDYIYE